MGKKFYDAVIVGAGVVGKVGTRPQLINTETWRLETDFVIEGGHHSTHILNAISPAFTGAFEFSRIVADMVEKGV